MGITIYSGLLALSLLVSSPWWLWRMATSGRYRAGLRGRLGEVPPELVEQVSGGDVVWLHAVSVGEVLTAERLIAELKTALPGWVIALSTTTESGYQVARQRMPSTPVFYMPLDFAYTMLRYLGVLRPKLVVLMESELWPRMLVECERGGVPVVVVNARISDRSFPRYLRLKMFWQPLMAKVTLFLAQGDESAERLAAIGASLKQIRVVGNLKFDAPVTDANHVAELVRQHLPSGGEVVVCGSTLEGEEMDILDAWVRLMSTGHQGVLILAPRHPQRFVPVAELIGKTGIRLSQWVKSPEALALGSVLLLDSIGSLAAMYQLATVAFIGGSLVKKGGHNPLEPARFGVPVVMGPSYENFREIVDALRSVDAISIVEHGNLTLALHQAMTRGRPMGRRAQEFYDAQTGATHRTVLALLDLLPKGPQL